MTAKEMLRDYLETMGEDEAEWVLDLLLRRPLYTPPPLTPEEIAHINEGRRQVREGMSIPDDEVWRRLGIADDAPETLTADELASVERGIEQLDGGEGIPQVELERILREKGWDI